MTSDNQIGHRFKLVRNYYRLTMKDVSEKLYLSQSTISNFENGIRNPSARTIKTFCETFGVNESWLKTGEGEMFAEQTDSETDAIAKEYGLSASGAALVRAFAELLEILNEDMQEQAFRTVYRTLQSAIPKLDNNPESMIVAEESDVWEDGPEMGHQSSR